MSERNFWNALFCGSVLIRVSICVDAGQSVSNGECATVEGPQHFYSSKGNAPDDNHYFEVASTTKIATRSTAL